MKHWIVQKSALVLTVIVLFLTGFSHLHSQDDRNHSTLGKDFWLSFLPNFHNQLDSLDRIHIFISSEVPTKGVITIRDTAGRDSVIPFEITNPKEMFSISWMTIRYELSGLNRTTASSSGIIVADPAFLPNPQKPNIHITSVEPIAVYALSQGDKTAEAFLVIPTDALETDFFILSYNSDGEVFVDGTTSKEVISGSSTPSQFCVLAVEDSTEVIIKPSDRTYQTKTTDTIKVMLNRGESYLVQASIDMLNQNRDLTGSEVRTSKPAAVFAGHQRATLPWNILSGGSQGNPSRDCLIEEIHPKSTFGRTAFLIPYPTVDSNATSGSDLYRILAAQDSTDIFLNGTFTTRLNRGQFYEAPLTRVVLATGSLPIMVAQYKKTANLNFNGNNQRYDGDPFMTIIPPSEQFLNSYRFASASARQRDGSGSTVVEAFPISYVTIVAPTSRLTSVRLDGMGLPSVSWTPILLTDYSYTHQRIQTGTHSVSADTGIGIYAHGYGYAVSYGYVGGMGLRRFDNHEPAVSFVEKCQEENGIFSELQKWDSGIDTVITENSINAFTQFVSTKRDSSLKEFDSVLYTVTPLDRSFDAMVDIVVYDSAGFKSTRRVRLPAFEMHEITALPGKIFGDFSAETLEDSTVCWTVQIVNSGFLPKTVTLGPLTPPFRFNSPPTQPLTIKPHGTVSFEVCATPSQMRLFTDSLTVSTSCFTNTIAAFTLRAGKDTLPPVITSEKLPCSERMFLATDSSRLNFGLREFTVIDSLSSNIRYATESQTVLTKTIRVTLIDPYQDGIVSFKAIDSIGNSSFLNDTIPGYTLSVSLPRGQSTHDFGSIPISTLRCDSITFHNYGRLRLNVNISRMIENIHFSIPQSQLPISIPPMDSIKLLVCFESRVLLESDSALFLDSIVFGEDCLMRAIPVVARTIPVELLGLSLCDIQVIGSISPQRLPSIVSLSPNPVSEVVLVTLKSPQKGLFTLIFTDVVGIIRKRRVVSIESLGTLEFAEDFSDLEQGMYSCQLLSQDESVLFSGMSVAVIH